MQDTLLSARVVVEGLAVAGIMWLASTVTQQNVAIARLQTQVVALTSSLSDVPSNTRSIAQLQQEQQEHERRLTMLEQRK
jgi:hypothetical protein